MIMISCDRAYFESVMKHHVSLDERINRKIVVPPLQDDEANLMIAKRLLEKRMVDDVDPLYPFTPTAISLLNQQAKGNPRHLLKSVDVVIDIAAKKRAIMVDEVLVRDILTLRQNQQLDVDIEAEPIGSVVETPVIVNVSNPKRSSNPIALPVNNPLRSDYVSNKSSVKRHSKNPLPPLESQENTVLENKKKSDRSQVLKSKLIKKKILSKKPQRELSEKQGGKSHSVSSLSSTSNKVAKVQCPVCSKMFTTKLNDDTISCPHCDFIGMVNTE
jgi:hypothetical protein